MTPSSKSFTHGELFAGISGFGLGFAHAGIKTKWHVEIDEKCQDVLRHHNPDNLILSDVRECGAENLPYVDIISFGSPCQDLSVAGKRRGLDGEKSNLFFEAARIVSELKPAFAVWENVLGALSSNSGRDFAIVLSTLRECGARDIAWRILDAKGFGVAQRRRRVFVVADFRGERAAQILFESESMSGNSETRREAGTQVAAPITASPPSRRNGGSDPVADSFVVATFDPVNVTSNVNRTRVESGLPANTLHQGGLSIIVETANAITTREGQRMEPSQETLIAFDYAAQGSERTFIHRKNEKAQLTASRPDAIAFDWQSGGDVRLNVSDKTSALQSSQTPATQGEFGVRRLTPTECEILQGFPRGYTAVNDQSDSARYRQLGNAVCVPVIAWLGARIVAVEEAASEE